MTCKECVFKRIYKKYGNTTCEVICTHPNRKYIQDYYDKHDIKKFLGFIGFINSKGKFLIKKAPKWCPLIEQGKEEENEKYFVEALEKDRKFKLQFQPKPCTNFDRITENEGVLAEFIERYATNCNYCPLYKLEKCNLTGWKIESENCKKEIKKWLQEECKHV